MLMIPVWILIVLIILYCALLPVYFFGFKRGHNIKQLKEDKNVTESLIAKNNETINEQKEQINKIDKKISDTTIELEKVVTELKEKENKLQEQNHKIENVDLELEQKNNQLKNLIEVYNQQEKDSIENLKAKIAEEKEKRTSELEADFFQHQSELQNRRQQLEEEYNKEKEHFNAILQDYQSKRESIIKISKEEEEIRQKSKFYTLQISTADLADITILEQVKPNLSRPDILSKLIYKTYYEKPYTDLVGRVVGTQKVTGIYKITNLINNKVYIGQAVDIAERWRQHIKRAVGAEPMTTNKLYPIMRETGPFNFSWQIVEECKKEELTAKEKYWIQYYDGQGYGYNIKG